jgi:hypothetical protein
MNRLDKFESIAWESQFAICLMANPELTEFALVDLTESAPSADAFDGFIARRFQFAGIAGICDGRPATALANPLDNASVDFLAGAVLAHLGSGAAKPKTKGNIEFMERLYALRRRIREN